MKNFIVALTTVLLMLMLGACVGNTTTTAEDIQTKDPAASTQSDTSSDSAATDKTTSEPVVDEPQIATFGASSDKFAESIRKAVADSDYPDLLSGEPTVTETEAGNSLPAHMTYQYEICPGASLVLYSVRDSSEMYQAFLSMSKSQITDEDMAKRVGYMIGLLESALEPDAKTRKEIDAQLGLDNTTEAVQNFATGTVATWMYIVDDENIMLNVMAN